MVEKGMRMRYTPEFEAWWEKLVIDPLFKTVAWQAWKAGREKLHEEITQLQVQN